VVTTLVPPAGKVADLLRGATGPVAADPRVEVGPPAATAAR
jgi:hypothetical protein